MEKKPASVKTASPVKKAAQRTGSVQKTVSKAHVKHLTAAQKKKLAKKKQQKVLLFGAAAVLILIILLLCVLIPHGADDETKTVQSTATPEPTAAPTPAVTAEPWTELLPVITQGDPATKQIAITIDDLNEVNNLNIIMDLCVQYGAKITLFPIGEVVNRKEDLRTALRRAYNLGFEIENHGYDHLNLYSLTDEEMAYQVTKQNQAVNRALGLEYEMHFYRMKGGNGEYDLRSHMYLIQNGYKGVVHWTYSGTDGSVAANQKALDNGAIFLFHAKDSDLKKLQQLIPYFAAQGYKMVTLNEMFGYEPNATKALNGDAMSYPIPTASEFTYNQDNYMLIGKKRYTQMYAVQLIQNRLIELNYLDPVVIVDGDYGYLTKQSIILFQQLNGLEADGLAGAQTQAKLFSDSAVANPGVAFTPTPAPEQ